MKVNKAKIRRDIAKELADAFMASGEEYGCLASVYSHGRPAATAHANALLSKGVNLSKSNYPFAWIGNMADMFLSDAAKLVHSHFYPN